MSLLAVSFTLPSEYADLLGDALLSAGALSINIDDARAGTEGEQPIFGEPGSESRLWPECRMTALVSPDTSVAKLMSGAAAMLEVEVPDYSVAQVQDIDWVRASREQFQPIRISDRLHVVPSWQAEKLPKGDAGAIHLVLDPGAAFGTGSHPTTRLCLAWLERRLAGKANASVLDYGCGSGILAIAAMRLGASRAVGVDIDPQAIVTARYNAERNQVAAQFCSSDHGLDMQADITVANILANPLIVLAPLLASHTRVGGQLALSGILAHQANEVLAAYRPWFDIVLESYEDQWVCLAGSRLA
jgi:ribosomal protein L11 methyltransferase